MSTEKEKPSTKKKNSRKKKKINKPIFYTIYIQVVHQGFFIMSDWLNENAFNDNNNNDDFLNSIFDQNQGEQPMSAPPPPPQIGRAHV